MPEEAHCMICGRLLTDPLSVKRGIGPVCYAAILKKRREKEAEAILNKDIIHEGCSEYRICASEAQCEGATLRCNDCQVYTPDEEAEASG